MEIGGGVYFSSISHYETVLDLVTEKLSQTKGVSPILSARLFSSLNLFQRSVSFRVACGADCIWEEKGVIPVPSLTVAVRFYPFSIYKGAGRFHQALKGNRSKDAEALAQKAAPAPQLSPTLQEFLDRGFVELSFDVGVHELTEQGKVTLYEIGRYLEEHPEEAILIQGHSAPFDSVQMQFDMGLRRADHIRSFLRQHFNIAGRRIQYESQGAAMAGGIVPAAPNEFYAQYRKAVIFRVANQIQEEEIK